MDPSNERPKVVLLVEDNPDDADLALRQLRKEGFGSIVIRFRDPVAVLAWLRSHTDLAGKRMLVLLDQSLIGMTGRELLETMRAEPDPISRIPVVILTGSKELTTIVLRGCKHPPIGVIQKPLRVAELEQILANSAQDPPGGKPDIDC
jgi:CheY-like chemotaxis protein